MAINLKHFLAFAVLATVSASATPNFTSDELEQKDYKEMSDMAYEQTRKCYGEDSSPNESVEVADDDEIDTTEIKQTPEVTKCLKQVVAFVLTRRDKNDAVTSDLVRKQINEIQEVYRMQVLKELTSEAIEDFKRNSGNKKLQNTAYERIKNILAEVRSRSRLPKSDGVKPILEMIKNADLDIDRKFKSYRANGAAGRTFDLVDEAKTLLKSMDKLAAK